MNEQLQSTCCEQLILSSRLDYKECDNTRSCFLLLKFCDTYEFRVTQKTTVSREEAVDLVFISNERKASRIQTNINYLRLELCYDFHGPQALLFLWVPFSIKKKNIEPHCYKD